MTTLLRRILTLLIVALLSVVPSVMAQDYPTLCVEGDSDHDIVQEDPRIGGINLRIGSLHGMEIDLGVAQFQYDERWNHGPESDGDRYAGNFWLKSVRFQRGLELPLPIIGMNDAGNPTLLTGAYRIALSESFSYELDEEQTGYESYMGHAPRLGGRYIVLQYYARGRLGKIKYIHDTQHQIVYGVESINGIPKPRYAYYPDGSTVRFEYNEVGKLIQLALSKMDESIETISIEYHVDLGNYLIQRVSSNRDAGDSVTVSYTPLLNVKQILRGGTWSDGALSNWIEGRSFDYVTSGFGSQHNQEVIKTIYSISPTKSSVVADYELGYLEEGFYGGGHGCVVYRAVRAGPAPIEPTRLAYLVGQDYTLRVQVTDPRAPGNPTTMVISGLGGNQFPPYGKPIETWQASCSWPIEKITYAPTGSALEGLIERSENRPRCTEASVVTDYHYSAHGSLQAVSVTTDGHTNRTEFEDTRLVLKTGLRKYETTRLRNALGNATRYDFSSETGLLSAVTAEDENLTTQVNYSFYADGMSNTHVKELITTEPNGVQTVELFDRSGRSVETRVNPGTDDEAVIRKEYDRSSGRLSRFIDERGNTTDYVYRAPEDNRLAKVVSNASDGSEQVETRFTYHAGYPLVPEVTEVTTSAGSGSNKGTTQLVMRDDVPLAEEIRFKSSGTQGFVTLSKTEYDPATLQEIKNCGFSVDGTDQRCAARVYKSAGLLQGYVDYATKPGGGRSTPLYNQFGEEEGALVQRDESTTIEIHYTFDTAGRVVQVVTNPPQGADDSQSTAYEYDEFGRMVHEWHYVQGALTSSTTTTFDRNGASFRARTIEDSMSGIRTEYQYDTQNRLTRSSTTFVPAELLLSEVRIDQYDQFNRPVVSTLFFNGKGSARSEQHFNKFGDLTTVLDAYGNLTSYDRYDSWGRLREWHTNLGRSTADYVIGSDGFAEITQAYENATSDASLRFPLLMQSKMDGLGRLVEVRNDQSSTLEKFEYDNRGDMVRNVRTVPGGNVVSEHAYDAQGRVVRESYQGDVRWNKTYNWAGQLLSVQDSRGKETRFEYDRLGRQRRTHYPDGATSEVTNITFHCFDGACDPLLTVESIDRADDRSTISTNRYGQVISSHTESAQLGPRDEESLYQGGRPKRKSVVTREGTSSIEYGYDSVGRVNATTTKITSPIKNTSVSLGRIYDTHGSLVGHVYPNGVQVQYERDQYGRISRITKDGAQIASYRYDGPVLLGSTIGPIERIFEYRGPLPVPLLYGVRDKVMDGAVLSDVTLSYDDRFQLVQRNDRGPRDVEERFIYHGRYFNTLDHYEVQSPHLGGTIVQRYKVGLDGILDGLPSPRLDDLFKLPDAFSYDQRALPQRERDGERRQFEWNHAGLTGLRNPSRNAILHLLHDPMGTNVWVGKELDGVLVEDSTMCREGGMVLWQAEAS